MVARASIAGRRRARPGLSRGRVLRSRRPRHAGRHRRCHACRRAPVLRAAGRGEAAVRSRRPRGEPWLRSEGLESLAYSVGVARTPDLFEAFNIGPDDVDEADPFIAAERHRLFAPNMWPAEVPALRSALVAVHGRGALGCRHVDGGVRRGAAVCRPGSSTRSRRTRPTPCGSSTTRRSPVIRIPSRGSWGWASTPTTACARCCCADPVPGLQIVGPDGRWHDVLPSPGALLVNLGDLMAQWTNDRWRSTLHRVLPARSSRRPRCARVDRWRSSTTATTTHSSSACRRACCPARSPKYAPVVAGEHLMAKLMGPRLLTRLVATDTTGGRLDRLSGERD